MYIYPYIVKYYRKNILFKLCGPQIRPIALKQLNSLTSMNTFNSVVQR